MKTINIKPKSKAGKKGHFKVCGPLNKREERSLLFMGANQNLWTVFKRNLERGDLFKINLGVNNKKNRRRLKGKISK